MANSSLINTINTGSGINSGDGDSLRTAFNKINSNFLNLEDSFVKAGVTSFNSQTGILTFTATDISNLLGFTPYPDTNPEGFVTSSTVSLSNYATLSFVTATFVSASQLANFNYISKNYVDAQLTEYATLVYVDNQGFITPTTLPNYLLDYPNRNQINTLNTDLRNYVTSTVYAAVSQNSIVPEAAGRNNLGTEEYTFNNAYLAGALYLQGIGISVDPVTARFYVNGNELTGGYVQTPQAIWNGDNYSFSISSSYHVETGNTGYAGIEFPSDQDVGYKPLRVYNTGTSGLKIEGSQTQINIDRGATVGLSVTGNVITPLTLKGDGFLGSRPEVGHHSLQFTPNSVVAHEGTSILGHQAITSLNTNTYAGLLIKGNRLNFYASDKFEQNIVPSDPAPALISLGVDGLSVGRGFARGNGAPSDAGVYESYYKLGLEPGDPGQYLQMAPNGVDTQWVTVSGGVNFSSIAGSILPALDLTYNLGSATKQWKSLFVGTSTIYLGGIPLSATPDGAVVVGTSAIRSDRLTNSGYTVGLDQYGNVSLPGNIVPSGDNRISIGSAQNRIKRLSVASDITIGTSVIKQAVSGNIIIPGLTTSTVDIAQGIYSISAETQGWPAVPEIIDNYRYKVLTGQLSPAAGWTPATYTCTGIDNKGYITGVSIATTGTGYTGIVATEAEKGMWAAENGVPLDPFDSGYWTQVNFGVISGPGDVRLDLRVQGADQIGGNTDIYKFESGIIGTKDNPDTGGWGGYNISLDPGGESSGGIFIPSVSNQQSGGILQIFNNDHSGGKVAINTWGGMTVASARGTLGLGLDLEAPGAPSHFHVAFETSNQFIPTADLYFGDDYNYLRLVNTAQGVFIGTNDRSGGDQQEWRFNTNGTMTFPTKTVNLHNGGNQSGQVLQFGDPNKQVIITGPTPTNGANAQRLIIQGQYGDSGEGGDVYLWAGDSQGNGGDIKIYAGDADASPGSGGYINIDAGNGYSQGGNLTLTAGNSALQGGFLDLKAGYASQGTSGNVRVITPDGSKVWDFGADGTFNLPLITSITTQAVIQATGDIVINANSSGQWKFRTDGGLTFPDGKTLRTGEVTGSLTFENDIIKGNPYGQVGTLVISVQDAQNNDVFRNGNVFYLPINSNTTQIQPNWPVTFGDGSTATVVTSLQFGSYIQVVIDQTKDMYWPIVVASPDYVSPNQANVVIRPNAANTTTNFTFRPDGGLTYPDGSIQYSAVKSVYDWALMGNDEEYTATSQDEYIFVYLSGYTGGMLKLPFDALPGKKYVIKLIDTGSFTLTSTDPTNYATIFEDTTGQLTISTQGTAITVVMDDNGTYRIVSLYKPSML